jgi:hypothetical protein
MPELSKLLDFCSHLMHVRFDYFLVRVDNVISGGIVNATQKIQCNQIILVQFTELLG